MLVLSAPDTGGTLLGLSSDAVAGLGGVLVGVLLSTVSSAMLIRFQRRSSEKHEVWMRILNGYQDFSNHARSLFFKQLGPEARDEAFVAAHKCLSDVETLDKYAGDRAREMRSILESLAPGLSTEVDAAELTERIAAVYADFRADKRLRFRRYP